MRITPVAAVAAPTTPNRVATVPAAAQQVPVCLPNPQPVIDPALGIVVTECFSRSGQMTDRHPRARAIDTCRICGLHGGTDELEPEPGTSGS